MAMSIKKNVKEVMISYMKSRDSNKIEICRLIIAEMRNLEIDKKTDQLEYEDELKIVQRIEKQKQETIDFCEKANSPLLSEEREKLVVIRQFLPQKMTQEEVEKIIQERISQEENPNIGTIMGYLSKNFAGKYDAKFASEFVKKNLIK